MGWENHFYLDNIHSDKKIDINKEIKIEIGRNRDRKIVWTRERKREMGKGEAMRDRKEGKREEYIGCILHKYTNLIVAWLYALIVYYYYFYIAQIKY